MEKMTIAEIISATNGRLLSGNTAGEVNSADPSIITVVPMDVSIHPMKRWNSYMKGRISVRL